MPSESLVNHRCTFAMEEGVFARGPDGMTFVGKVGSDLETLHIPSSFKNFVGPFLRFFSSRSEPRLEAPLLKKCCIFDVHCISTINVSYFGNG